MREVERGGRVRGKAEAERQGEDGEGEGWQREVGKMREVGKGHEG